MSVVRPQQAYGLLELLDSLFIFSVRGVWLLLRNNGIWYDCFLFVKAIVLRLKYSVE